MGMTSARFDPRSYFWVMPKFKYAFVFIVPGDWDDQRKDIWSNSEFAPVFEWLRERHPGQFYCEVNRSDGVITPVEVHIMDRLTALMLTVHWINNDAEESSSL